MFFQQLKAILGNR